MIGPYPLLGAPRQSERQREVDRRGHGGGALRALLHAAAGQDVRAPPAAVRRAAASSRAARRSASAGTPLTCSAAPATRGRRCGARRRAGRCAPSGTPRRPGPRRARRAAMPEQHREVRAGHRLQVDAGAVVGELGGRACAGGRSRSARRLPGPRRGARPRAASSRRGCCRRSSTASAPPRSASGNGSPRSMPKARLAGRGGAAHAEPTVVVDVRRAQHRPGELAQRVGLLVGQPAAAEHRDGVVAVLRPAAPANRRWRRGRAPRPSSPRAARRPRRGPAAWSAGRAARSTGPRSSPSGTGRPGWWGSRARRPATGSGAAAGCGVSVIAHCRAQYGQCVADAVASGCRPARAARPLGGPLMTVPAPVLPRRRVHHVGERDEHGVARRSRPRARR